MTHRVQSHERLTDLEYWTLMGVTQEMAIVAKATHRDQTREPLTDAEFRALMAVLEENANAAYAAAQAEAATQEDAA